ncbi:MAG TPA: ABC transporter ATP-binding protein [Rectinemataceae bacterium]|nr:ABC transporter ATP-binding protein [Rectinemataceae bacterium]
MNDRAIQTRAMTKKFAGFDLRDVTLSLETGSVLGLIGPNGAGKTTTIKLLGGLLKPDLGNVEVLGENPWGAGPTLRRKLGIVSDESQWYGPLSAADTEAWVKRLYPRWDSAGYEARLSDFGIDRRKRLSDLSKGQKMKFSLAVALSHEAELIILDEPTSGLDPVSRSELLDTLHSVVAAGTTSILFSTHITSDLERIADHIAFIMAGKIVFCEDIDSVLDRHAVIRGPAALLDTALRAYVVGARHCGEAFEGLTDRAAELRDAPPAGLSIERASLEDIMVYTAREDYRVRAVA